MEWGAGKNPTKSGASVAPPFHSRPARREDGPGHCTPVNGLVLAIFRSEPCIIECRTDRCGPLAIRTAARRRHQSPFGDCQADRWGTSSIIALFIKSSTSKVNLQPYRVSKCPSFSRFQIRFYRPAIWRLDCGRDQVAFQNNFMVAGRRDPTALELIRSVYHRRYRHLMSHQQLYWRGSSPRTRCSRSRSKTAGFANQCSRAVVPIDLSHRGRRSKS